jgi:hypothetical protein
MAIRTDFTAGEVLAAADLNDTFAAKLNLAGGKILQVVTATHATTVTTTSTSYVVTGLSATITPSSASNKVLIIHTGTGGSGGTGVANANYFTIARGDLSGTNLGTGSNDALLYFYTDNSSTFRLYGSLNMSFMDSPATTSAQQYTVAMKSSANQSAVAQVDSIVSTLILMEVSA